MNCPNCLTPYNQGLNLPRILIGCGHTLCDYCISLLFDTAGLTITCPECFTGSSIGSPSQFPKNIALLNMSESSRKMKSPPEVPLPEHELNEFQLPQEGAATQEEEVTGELREGKTAAALCKVHHKKIEAFCVKDKSLLCIDCILADIHRAHKIESIPKAFELEREGLFGNYNIASELEEKLRSVVRDVERHMSVIGENAEHKRAEITAIFNEIRKVVH